MSIGYPYWFHLTINNTFRRVTVNGFEKYLCVWPHWTSWTWLPYLTCMHSSKVARTSTNQYFLYHTRSYQKGSTRYGFFRSSRLFLHLMKHDFYITSYVNDSSFQQSKLESLNTYTSKVIKLTNISLNTPPIIIA